MSEISINYKGSAIATMDASGTKTVLTQGKYCEDDIEVVYTRPSAPSPSLQSKTRTYTPTASQQTETVTADGGYDGLSQVGITVNAMPSGSATPASSITGTTATVSSPSSNKIKLTQTVSNTPQVSAGYITSGTAGNSSVSLTGACTTKSATTYYASTSDQTIGSGTYITGTQTFKAVSQTNLSAGNIKNGTTISISNGNGNIWSVTGTYDGGGGGGGVCVVTFDYDFDVYSVDKTFAEILAAYNGGDTIVVTSASYISLLAAYAFIDDDPDVGYVSASAMRPYFDEEDPSISGYALVDLTLHADDTIEETIIDLYVYQPPNE